METTGKRIQEALDIRHMKQIELARATGMGRGAISQYVSDKVTPKQDKLYLMAKALLVSPTWLMGYDVPMESDDKKLIGSNIDERSHASQSSANSYVHIPVLGAIPAGIPSEAIESVLDYEDIPADMAKHGNFYGLIARGHSMEPTINDGDVVIIRQQPTVESGEIAVVKLNGNEATLKEVKITDEGIFIIGHNRSAFEPMFLTHEQAKSLPLRILGKAVELRRTLGK